MANQSWARISCAILHQLYRRTKAPQLATVYKFPTLNFRDQGQVCQTGDYRRVELDHRRCCATDCWRRWHWLHTWDMHRSCTLEWVSERRLEKGSEMSQRMILTNVKRIPKPTNAVAMIGTALKMCFSAVQP